MTNILITGGTGSFGQAFTEYELKNNKFGGKIIIFSRDELKQEQMERKYKLLDSDERMRYLIGCVRDKDRLQLAISDAHYIIHAAALKRVPNAEYNPTEYIKTNILGSQNLIDCCLSAWNKGSYIKVIALSTDKAVSPINLYGATKLVMEKMILTANNIHGESGPKFSVVRYGNVADSNGSVIQVFKEQISKGLPITITDPKMTRFWITLESAVKFVIESVRKMNGGEVFIPTMPSFNVIDLARAFTHYKQILLPYEEDKNIKIIGIRPGEKLHEQINEDTFSNENDKWYTVADLRDYVYGNNDVRGST